MKTEDNQIKVLEKAFNDIKQGVQYLKNVGPKLNEKKLAIVIEIIKSDLDQIEKIYNH